jgi:hypothetical protein
LGVTHPPVVMPAARVEVIADPNWYDKQVSGMGVRFLDELDHQAGRISASPLQFPVMLADRETGEMKTFPLRVVLP